MPPRKKAVAAPTRRPPTHAKHSSIHHDSDFEMPPHHAQTPRPMKSATRAPMSVDDDDDDSDDLDSGGLDPNSFAAILEDFELETSSRTKLLRNRIQSQLLLTLTHRLKFEQDRLTPAVANVTAAEHMERDGGNLHVTMAIAARAIAEGGLRLGQKRSVDDVDQDHALAEDGPFKMSEIEQSARKRKRIQNPPSASNSLNGKNRKGMLAKLSSVSREDVQDGSFVVVTRPEEATKKVIRGRVQSPKRAARGTTTRSRSSTVEPQPPSFPTPSSFARTPAKPRKPRRAKQNEHLLSVNGSPILAPSNPQEDDEDGEIEHAELEHRHPRAANAIPSTEFTFSSVSRWKELERQLLKTDMDDVARARLQDMVIQLRITETGQ